MTKEQYNANIKRFHKAMAWYESKPSTEQIEKYELHFELLLEDLRVGALQLKPNKHEILGGFNG